MEIETGLDASADIDEIREAQWIAGQAELLAREEGFDSKAV